MDTIIRTPLAEWRQNDDGSWTPYARPTSGTAAKVGGGEPGGGSEFLTPGEVSGGDNIIVTELPGGNLLIEQGGHRILYGGVALAFRPNLDFQGNVTLVDDVVNQRTLVTIGGSEPSMRWRGEYDPDAQYDTGDVVWYLDAATGVEATFVWGDPDQGLGFGLGGFGAGPFGGQATGVGFGGTSFGSGPFGG